MASQTKAPTSAGGLLALFVAVMVVGGLLYGLARKERTDEGKNVTFTVVFEPAERVTNVEIVILVDGASTVADKARKSPWNVVLPLRKGQRAVLTATQSVPSKLSCLVNGEVQETRAFPGTVTCTHMRAKVGT